MEERQRKQIKEKDFHNPNNGRSITRKKRRNKQLCSFHGFSGKKLMNKSGNDAN
jgi:hypothetical protein